MKLVGSCATFSKEIFSYDHYHDCHKDRPTSIIYTSRLLSHIYIYIYGHAQYHVVMSIFLRC